MTLAANKRQAGWKGGAALRGARFVDAIWKPSPFGSTATTRTSASDGWSRLECGAPITGQRRSGFCSDRCRMRAGRVAKQERLEAALASIEDKVERFRVEIRTEIDSLRADLVGGVEREQRDQRNA